jgi:transcriptional regulator
MLRAITAFEMEIGAWRGTVKLGQDKPEEARLRVGEALAEQGQHEVVALMRRDGR